MRLLTRSVNKGDDPVNLNLQLHRRLVHVAMTCPGFTPLMKDDIAFIVRMNEEKMRFYNQPPHASSWRHHYALAPKPGVVIDVLQVSLHEIHLAVDDSELTWQ